MKRFALLLALPILLAATTPRVVTWSAPSVRRVAGRSGEAVIRVHGQIARGWHLYSLNQKPGGPKALLFELEPNRWYSLGPTKGPAAQHAYDAEFKMETETYSGTPVFLIPVRSAKGVPANSVKLRLTVRYQACSDKLCIPPRKEALTVTLSP